MPTSIYFILQGGYFLLFFLLSLFFAANYELFSVFKKKSIILLFDLILILSLYSIYYLRDHSDESFYILLWVIILVICSDIGGYIFGKLFKWKKFTKISPKKTLSGALGSFVFSLGSVIIVFNILPNIKYFFKNTEYISINFLNYWELCIFKFRPFSDFMWI